MNKSIWIIMITATIIFAGGKIYTDTLVQRAEAKYPPSNFVTAEGVHLHYVEAGTGRPVVVIPGGSGKVQDFSLSPLYQLAASQYQVIIIDRPGLGYSEKPTDEELTPDVQARLIHAALNELEIEKPIIVGQSWGGVIALAYAQEYSSELTGIVLLGSSPYPRERQTDFFNVIARTPVLGDFIVHTIYVPIGRHWIAPAIIEQNKDYFAPLDAVPETFRDSTIELGLRPSHVISSAKETLVIPTSLAALVSDLSKVEVLAIIVDGDQDTHAFEQSTRLKQDLPRSRVVIVEGANHYLWFSKPDVVMEAIQDLWIWSDQLSISR